MSEPNATAEQWCHSVAEFAADALLDATLVPRDRFEEVKVMLAQEIFVRLCCNDYPPPVDYAAISKGTLFGTEPTDKK
jgi:hypothetical protein